MNPVWFVFLCIALIGIVGLVATLLVVAGESDRRAEEATRGVKALADARASCLKSIAAFNQNLHDLDRTLGARARVMRGSGRRAARG
jgi:hypothetical protein